MGRPPREKPSIKLGDRVDEATLNAFDGAAESVGMKRARALETAMSDFTKKVHRRSSKPGATD